jgi:hypothetical protein
VVEIEILGNVDGLILNGERKILSRKDAMNVGLE